MIYLSSLALIANAGAQDGGVFGSWGTDVYGGVDFTYHIGYANAPGRHKLHARALTRSMVTAEYLF